MHTAFKGLLDAWPNSFGVHNLFGRKGSKWHTPTLKGMEGGSECSLFQMRSISDAPSDGCFGSTAVHPVSCGNRQQWVEAVWKHQI